MSRSTLGESLFVSLVAIVFVAVLSVAFTALFALPVEWLWNYVVPALFGLKSITFMQAWALNLLCSFLFKSSNTSTSSSSK